MYVFDNDTTLLYREDYCHQIIGFHRLCTLTLVHRIQIIGHSYIAQMEWPRIVPREIYIYLLYVCYSSENKQQQQQQH